MTSIDKYIAPWWNINVDAILTSRSFCYELQVATMETYDSIGLASGNGKKNLSRTSKSSICFMEANPIDLTLQFPISSRSPSIINPSPVPKPHGQVPSPPVQLDPAETTSEVRNRMGTARERSDNWNLTAGPSGTDAPSTARISRIHPVPGS